MVFVKCEAAGTSVSDISYDVSFSNVSTVALVKTPAESVDIVLLDAKIAGRKLMHSDFTLEQQIEWCKCIRRALTARMMEIQLVSRDRDDVFDDRFVSCHHLHVF